MKVQNLYNSVGKELGISRERVRMLYSGYWNFIKEGIKNLDIHNEMNWDDFNDKKYGFYIQGIGRLYCDYSRYKSQNIKLIKRRNAKHNKDKASV